MNYSRQLLFLLLLLKLASCKKPDEPITPNPSSTATGNSVLIPLTPTIYTISIAGTTYFGNTNFPTVQTKYTPEQNFKLQGTLHIIKGIADNPRDVALIVGYPASNPVAGSIWFGSNTRMFRQSGINSDLPSTFGIDIGPMVVDEKAGTLALEITNQNISRNFVLNNFNVRSGLLANVYQILYGTLKLTFAKNGSVKGEFLFNGNGYIEPSSTAIAATIEGQKQ